MSRNQSSGDQTTRSNSSYEGDTQTSGTRDEYDPEDFSQLAINRGQRRINYELVVVTLRLADAFEKLVEKLSAGDKAKFKEVGNLIEGARQTAKAVADIKPPGCLGPTPPPPTPE